MPQYLVGPSRPYTTIAAAMSAVPSNLVSNGQGVHEIVIDAGIYNASVNVPTFTSNASNYLHIRAANGAEHLGNEAGGVIIQATLSTFALSNPFTPFLRVSNIVCRSSGVGFNGNIVSNNGQNAVFSNVISVVSSNAQGVGFSCASSAQGSKFICCLARNANNSNNNSGYLLLNGIGVGFINCGSFNFNSFLNTNALGTATNYVTNSWSVNRLGGSAFMIIGSGTDRFDRSLCLNNATSGSGIFPDGDPSGSLVGLTLTNFGFVNAGGSNFHITQTSFLYGTGFNQSSLFSTDWDLEIIGIWCIGPDCYVPINIVSPGSSAPGLANRANHKKVKDAKPASIKVQYGERLSVERKASHVPQASNPVLVTSGNTKFIDGYVSILAEASGYGSPSNQIRNGFKMPIIKETLSLGKDFAEVEVVGKTKNAYKRVPLGITPVGSIRTTFRSNDALPIFMSHYQHRHGSALSGGTTYYEFIPAKNVPALTPANNFGTGTYGASTSRAFTISAYKVLNGTSERYYSGYADTLSIGVVAGMETELEASFIWKYGSLNDTDHGHSGSYSSKRNFPSHTLNVDFLGLELTSFGITSTNQAVLKKFVGSELKYYPFGKHIVMGSAVVEDIPSTTMAYLGSMLAGTSFPLSGTFFNNNADRAIFSMPNVYLRPFEVTHNNGMVIPFIAYESEDGATPSITWKFWTTGYNATAFQPS